MKTVVFYKGKRTRVEHMTRHKLSARSFKRYYEVDPKPFFNPCVSGTDGVPRYWRSKRSHKPVSILSVLDTEDENAS